MTTALVSVGLGVLAFYGGIQIVDCDLIVSDPRIYCDPEASFVQHLAGASLMVVGAVLVFLGVNRFLRGRS